MRKPSQAQIDAVESGLEEAVKETEGLGPPAPDLLKDCVDGEVLPIRHYPDPHLRSPTTEVGHFDESLRKLLADMATTMYAVGGIGLAAPQIGVPRRVFIVDLLNSRPVEEGKPASQLLVVVNPRLWALSGETRKDAERCLSFPDVVELVSRPSRIVLKAFDRHGNPYALGCGSDLARAIQHEYDHLEGKLLIDRVSKTMAREVRKRIRSRATRFPLTVSRQ